jgi:tetratricopeptide (TPR) repeat protein
MTCRLGAYAAALITAAICQTRDLPVGLITAAQDAKIRRAGSNLALGAPVGEFVFSGDVIFTGSQSATLAFCSQKANVVLAGGGEFTVSAESVRTARGRPGVSTPLASCELPPVERGTSANLFTYGSTMTRGGKPAPIPSGSSDERIRALPESKRVALEAALGPVREALAQRPDDLAALITRASLYLRFGLDSDALEQFTAIGRRFETPSLRGLTHDLDARQTAEAPQDMLKDGKTYALLVGISRYQRLAKQDWLAYADADADAFADFFRSPRGGAIPGPQTQLLTNERATTAAIRNGLYQFLDSARKNDTIILLIAAHGVVDDKTGEAYIVTADSDPEDLRATALPMSELQKLMYERLTKVGRALVFVDVCRAGTIGTIRSNNINRVVQEVLKAPGELLGFMASRSTEYSWEGANWGGGHGAFSYFLLRALAGEADQMGNNDGMVDVNELIEYVRAKVRESTRDEQHPVETTLTLKNSVELADTEKPGITLEPWVPIKKGLSRGRSMLAQSLAPARTRRDEANQRQVADFETAIQAGRIIPETPGSAFNILHDRLKTRLTPEQYRIAENELRVALEDHGQQVLLRYLEGDQIPQARDSFEAGARYFQAARMLTPESALLESKELFCRGRVLIFEKRYAQSAALLEQAARIDSRGAYSYNALGINYLERSQYDLAIAAFRDAMRRAPHWAYPAHNLALAYTEQGAYSDAIRTYQAAMKIAPSYAYLPYNLGLLYQRLNLRKEAELCYQKTLELSPGLDRALAALGLLYATEGKLDLAEKDYRAALSAASDPILERHNLGLLLIRRKQQAEAIELWRQNEAADPNYLPSRLLLARELARQGNENEAIREYRAVVELKPDFTGARIELSRLLARAGNLDESILQLEESRKRRPSSALLAEKLGDLYAQAGRLSEARAAWATANEADMDKAQRKRLRQKQAGPGGPGSK